VWHILKGFVMHHLQLIPQSGQRIREAYEDFILSRKAALYSPKTIQFYEETTGGFISWLLANGFSDPNNITVRHVRTYISKIASRRVSDATIHKHARGMKTFIRFCYSEGYTSELVTFTMPKVGKKRHPVLSPDEVKRLVDACTTPRDKAMILVLIDTGIRASEFLALDWKDVDIGTGLVRIRSGKGKKSRSVIIGINTRRALLAYRRIIPDNNNSPLFQTIENRRLRYHGLRSALRRVGKRAGLKVGAHMLRRSFATLSLRAGINPIHLQALMGHSSLEMTRRYIQMIDDDLIDAHREYGPVDKFLR
jgi:site-specific recombinase XerD